jgi:small subunit ribosomal protein S8
MTDPIADLLARIRNAQTARHDSLSVPHSKMKAGIVKVLYEEGFVGPFKVVENESGRKEIQMTIRYIKGKEPLIAGMVRSSRSGRRYYVGYRDIRPVLNGIGISILSTPKGILTDRQAKEEKVGGELLCKIW